MSTLFFLQKLKNYLSSLMIMPRPQKRRFQSDIEKKEKYNTTISSAIADIIRFSLDDQFRSKCFDLMQVNNTNDFQHAIKEKLDSLVNSRSNTSPPLQKRSFHETEAERNFICSPDRNGMNPEVNVEEQADEVDKTESLENIEVPTSPIQKTTDSHIAEIVNFLNTTNIIMEGNIEEQYTQPGTSGVMSTTSMETEEEIKKDISHMNVTSVGEFTEEIEKIEDFWPTEECFLWGPNIMQENDGAMFLQKETIDIDLNENDTDWQ